MKLLCYSRIFIVKCNFQPPYLHRPKPLDYPYIVKFECEYECVCVPLPIIISFKWIGITVYFNKLAKGFKIRKTYCRTLLVFLHFIIITIFKVDSGDLTLT